jgi:hypothetical protein
MAMLKDSDVKFFRPLWIRVTVTAVCVAWFAAEAIFSRDPLWLSITGIAIAYCVWNLFLRFPKDLPAAPDEPGPH